MKNAEIAKLTIDESVSSPPSVIHHLDLLTIELDENSPSIVS